MALYPDNMTYEEMMEELARLVAKMIMTYEPNESPNTPDDEKKIPKRTKKVKNIDTNSIKSDSSQEGLSYDI